MGERPFFATGAPPVCPDGGRSQDSFVVVGTEGKAVHRRVTLQDAKGTRTSHSFHRFAQVSKGDQVFIDPEHPSRVAVISVDNAEDRIRVSPIFELLSSIKLGAETLKLRIAELLSQEDLDNYAYLEAFHYRSSSGAFEESESEGEGAEGQASEEVAVEESTPASVSSRQGGRKAVLLCTVQIGKKWQPVGYIELQMPLLMVKPRHELFSLPFDHDRRPISWKVWDQHAIRSYVNCIVRIARVVTSPEYRGLGLSKQLVSAAKEYARERWHIGGRRPLFIEISAEMLRHVDFVSSSGLCFAGNTEGNLRRIHSDMSHMRKNYEISSGIMSLQKKYLTKLKRGAEALGRDLDAMLDLVEAVTSDDTKLGQLSPAEYYYIRSVLRLPIPYFIGGLDDCSQRYVEAAIDACKKRVGAQFVKPAPSEKLAVKSGRISFSNISVSSNYKLPSSPHVRAIMDCFGLEGAALTDKVISNLKLEASGGNIIFISGPSGAGKSLLLKALDPRAAVPHITFKREASLREKYTVGWMEEIDSDAPLIEHFSERWGMDRALAALNQAGLSEAFVYLKPFRLLSRGQKYRAKLAHLALRDEQVWLIDEFCADLDPVSAKIVATNLRKHTIKYQRIAIVAAANHDHFLSALRPTRVVLLRHGFEPAVMTYREYADEFLDSVG